MSRRNNDVLQGIRPGQTITADWLSRVASAVNRNSAAVSAPAQRTIGAEGSGVSNETWSAGASDFTDETVTLTDSNGDTSSVERITSITFTNDLTGATMTLNITYS